MKSRPPPDLPVVGWREWLALPDLGIPWIKAKIDTGARTSSLHIFGLETMRRAGEEWIRFQVHPLQRTTRETVYAEAPVLEYRKVRSSTGHSALRPVIVTDVVLKGETWPIEVTLANRDSMGFRMLLGRQAVRHRFHVDPGRSFYSVRPKRKKKKKAASRERPERK
jgi:hypothetical protein